MEETKWLSKPKIIFLIILFLAIVMSIVGYFINKAKLEKEYIRFESQLVDGARNYLESERIDLKSKEWRYIDVKDILKNNYVINSYGKDCNGYVIAKASVGDGKIPDSITYKPYIKCKNIYISKKYGYKPNNKNQNTVKPQSKNDTEKPIITLFGDEKMSLHVGEKYKEEGAVAQDNVDGNITKKIKVRGRVDSKIEGTYIITYSVSDSSKNVAVVRREVNVVPKDADISIDFSEKDSGLPDTIKPIISFYNDRLFQTICLGNIVNIDENGPYGYFAVDNVDGNITNKVEVSGDVDLKKFTGTYSLVYKVSDSAGNVSNVSRNYSVKRCDEQNNEVNSSVPVQTISLSPKTKLMVVGDKMQLSVKITPENATNKNVIYGSSNNAVATVSSTGEVNAISKGNVKISVTSSNGIKNYSTITIR